MVNAAQLIDPVQRSGLESPRDGPHRSQDVDAAGRSDGEVERWLQRLSTSPGQYNYRGILIYQRGDHTESLRITHGQLDGREYERLEHLDGEPRELVRHGERLTRIHSGSQLTRLYHKRLAFSGQLQALRRHYRLSTVGADRVAGRHSVVIAIEPRDQLRYGYRLIVDRETALVLGWELIDTNGAVLERFRFAAIDVGIALTPESLGGAGYQDAGSHPETVTQSPAQAASTVSWRPEWLPSGFGLAQPVIASPETVQTYSDGLAVLSIFIEPAAAMPTATPTEERDGAARQGATTAYLHHTHFKGERYTVTVLGEIPEVTAQQVAHSITWLGGEL